jgi:hypothetical protein
MQHCLTTFCLLLCLSCPLLAQIRTLSFYVVRPTVSAPVLDGRLDDEAWQNVPVHNAYYEYAKPDPGPGKLKTSFMMTYDERGLYVGIVNYEEHMIKSGKMSMPRMIHASGPMIALNFISTRRLLRPDSPSSRLTASASKQTCASWIWQCSWTTGADQAGR